MNSACSVGIAIVENGQVVDTFYSLIQPPDNYYDPQNILVHGISEDDTLNAPKFDSVWWEIYKYFGPYPVLAHNAHFDMSVLSMCCKDNYIKPDNFKYMDTINLAKNIVPGNKSLVDCVNFFEITLDHHNALADAVSCAEIAIACLRYSGESDLLRFCFKSPHIKIYNFSDLRPSEVFLESKGQKNGNRKHFNYPKASEIIPQNSSFDINHPFYQKSIVFTGELSIDRHTAMQMAVDAGAIIRTSVSSKTHFLVVGQQDPGVVGSDGVSGKERSADKINASGKGKITILSEAEFFALVGEKQKAGEL